MGSTEQNRTHRPDGTIEALVREWITSNVAATDISLKALGRITRRVDRALGLGFSGGLAYAAIHKFVKRVLSERGVLVR